jgi:CHAD domain-containing protein
MPLAKNAVSRQPGKLRKALKKLRKDTSPDAVHKLRTRTRRLEAMIAALALDSRNNERLLLRALKPLRRKAGRVRDMDVLTRFASRPQLHGEEQCSIQLLERLGAERERQAMKLEDLTRAQYPEVRKRLRKFATVLNRTLPQDRKPSTKAKSRSRRWTKQATAVALELEGELRRWPTLNRDNLHPFRLKVKKLRYVLQMAEGNESGFVAALGEVKDAIGEWHDWQELSEIAKELIQHSGCRLRQSIDHTAQERFAYALRAANQLRQNYLREKPQRHSGSTRQNPAIISASALAA